MHHIGQLALVWFLILVVWLAGFFLVGLDYGRASNREVNTVIAVLTTILVSIGLAVSIGIMTTNATW